MKKITIRTKALNEYELSLIKSYINWEQVKEMGEDTYNHIKSLLKI